MSGDSIHVLMARILGELPAIGKDSYNEQQKFHFRGIDDVMNALNPLLAAHGVFFVPDVVERVESERATRSGSAMYVVNLHVRFRFYGPNGDCIEASGWGEGTDMGDKATNKAMTGAMKYVLFQTFAISTKDAAEGDGDAGTPEPTTGSRRGQSGTPLSEQLVPSSIADKLTARMNALPEAVRAQCKREFAGTFGKPSELRRGDSEAAEAMVTDYEQRTTAPSDTQPTNANPPSPKLRGAVHAAMTDAGITDEIRHDWATNVLERDVPVVSYSELSADDYSALLDHLKSTAAAS